MKKSILYLMSDTGGGHRASAEALISTVDELYPHKFNQKMVDVFAQCSSFLNIFARLYAPVIKYSPKLWGRLYFWLDDPGKLDLLEKIAAPFILKDLIRLIQNEKPDIIVSVHPLVNHLTVRALKESRKKIPFMVVITDPVTVHRAWVTPEADLYIVATFEAKRAVIHYGFPARKIKVLGIPIRPGFAKPLDSARGKGKFTILMMGGGEGAGSMFQIIKEINRSSLDDLRLMVIAGRNKRLEEKLKRSNFNFPLKVYGFTSHVPELMSVSDMIITKAGPGTIAESLAMNLPMIITSWLPGQEEGNVTFVKKEKVGFVTADPQKVVRIIKQLRDPKLFERIKVNISRVRRPKASFDIVREIIERIP
jgi:1,2-diacylglycerol 3-beta-galactosyltransferase